MLYEPGSGTCRAGRDYFIGCSGGGMGRLCLLIVGFLGLSSFAFADYVSIGGGGNTATQKPWCGY